MAVKVGINGFGRIGRLVYRAGYKNPNLEFVATNDITDAPTLAHLLKYDSVHGKMDAEIKAEGNKIMVGGDSESIERVYAAMTIAKNCVAEVLADYIERGTYNKRMAVNIIKKMFRENAQAVYQL